MVTDISVEKTILLKTILENYNYSHSMTSLKNLCEKLGTENLYNSLSHSLNEKLFDFLLNPLSEYYQKLRKANEIQGDDYLERTKY
ncbi:hypothetical protein, partial [Jeotgalibaca arthritidis]